MTPANWRVKISYERQNLRRGDRRRGAFTLLEMLIVIAIISLLMAITMPVLINVRRNSRKMLSSSNQCQIVRALNLYASDNENRYPESVATIGSPTEWCWQAPFVLTGINSHAPKTYYAMSEYLRGYIDDASIMFCPSAPKKYKYLQQSWDAGENWHNPDTWLPWVKGTYCFWWDYTGLLENDLFEGPRNLFGNIGTSKMMVSCYFGYDNWRSEGSFGSCEKFDYAQLVPEKPSSSAYWSRDRNASFDLEDIKIKFRAGFTDGHVETFNASDTVELRVIVDRHTLEPHTYGPGSFFIPTQALH